MEDASSICMSRLVALALIHDISSAGGTISPVKWNEIVKSAQADAHLSSSLKLQATGFTQQVLAKASNIASVNSSILSKPVLLCMVFSLSQTTMAPPGPTLHTSKQGDSHGPKRKGWEGGGGAYQSHRIFPPATPV